MRISEELAEHLGAETSVVLEPGVYAACAIRMADCHLLLVRHFGASFTISLPSVQSFSFRSLEEFRNEVLKISRSVTDYRSKNRVVFTMADCVIQLKAAVTRVDAHWQLNIPGTPVPSEMWLTNSENHIGLFQEGASIRVGVWVGNRMHSFTVNSAATMSQLGGWVIPRLQQQAVESEQIADQEKKTELILPPPFEQVMAYLNSGARLQLGSGRWYETFFITEQKLCHEIFDEGRYDEEQTTEEELLKSLKRNAAQAHKQLKIN